MSDLRWFSAEPVTDRDGWWNVYRSIRVNGEREHVYLGTVEAPSAVEAAAQGPQIMRETANVRWSMR